MKFYAYVTPSVNGMMFIIRTVFLGVTPAKVNPAQDSAPNTPAPPAKSAPKTKKTKTK